jgi:hypothetical protein
VTNKYEITSTDNRTYEIEARSISGDSDFIYFHGDTQLLGMVPTLNIIIVKQVFSNSSELLEFFRASPEVDKD